MTILYFGKLRADRGLAEETVQTAATDAAELWQDLCDRFGWPTQIAQRVAIDHEFTDFSVPLRDGATVAFMPPLAGG